MESRNHLFHYVVCYTEEDSVSKKEGEKGHCNF